jgi:hypothetical protein
MFVYWFEIVQWLFVSLIDIYVCVLWNCVCVSGFDDKLYNLCLFIWNYICMCIGGFDNVCILIWNCIMFVCLKFCCLFEIVYVSSFDNDV